MTNTPLNGGAVEKRVRFFVLRTPLLPMKTMLAGECALAASKADGPTELATAIVTDRKNLRLLLRDLIRNPVVREALFVSSPDLFARLPEWEADSLGAEGDRIDLSLTRYLTRMSTRPTPFGLCAGVALGVAGSDTIVSLPNQREWRRHTRLDMGLITNLARFYEDNASVRQHLTYRPNSSLYAHGGELRYARYSDDANGRSFSVARAEISPYLTAVLQLSLGNASFAELKTLLLGFNVNDSEASEYLNEVISAQLLVSSLEPVITGGDALDEFIASLPLICAPDINQLASIRDDLRSLDGLPIGDGLSDLEHIRRRADGLPVTVRPKELFHMDLHIEPSIATIGPATIRSLHRAAAVLDRLLSAQRLVSDRDTPLGRFKESFERRYADREASLAEVLDEDSGLDWAAIGRGPDTSSLLQQLNLPEPRPASLAAMPNISAQILSCLGTSGLRTPEEICLTENDIDKLCDNARSDLSASFTVIAKLGFDEQGPKTYVKGIVPNGASWLARFCHGNDKLRNALGDLLSAEERDAPDKAFAEVVHLPRGRFGNFIARPILHEYEIPYLGRSGAESDHQLAITDLSLRMSNGRLELRSASLGREVHPSLGNAHNAGSNINLPIYRLLFLLQFQERRSGSWSWGSLDALPFLPRVSFESVILSLAQWQVSGAEVATLDTQSPESRYASVQRLRQQRSLPRFVVFAEGDNELAIDLDNTAFVDILIGRLKQLRGGLLTELFPLPNHSPILGANGLGHSGEILVPFFPSNCSETPRAAPAPPVPRRQSRVSLSFAPGSEWAYAKIYTGRADADKLLAEYFRPVVDELCAAHIVDKWFFVRYSDPDFHIRLRLHGSPQPLWNEGVPLLNARIQAAMTVGLCHRVQFETYEPETDRYGGPVAIAIAETLFWHDSVCVLSNLSHFSGDIGREVRWRWCIRSVDSILTDFGFGTQQKFALTDALQAFHNSWPAHKGKDIRQRLSDGFRALRSEVECLLDQRPPGSMPLETVQSLCARSLAWRTDIEALRHNITKPDQLTAIVGSLIHMHVNRAHRYPHPYHEFVAYDFLTRIYRGQLGRAKFIGTSRVAAQI